MTDTNPSGSKVAEKRWPKWLLAGSLTLNLVILGIAGGAVLRHAGGDDRPITVRDLSFGPFTDALSREDRAALRQGFLAQPEARRGARRLMWAEFDQLLVALRATPFDLAAVQSAMAQQESRMAERLTLGNSLLVNRISAMTDTERRGFADRLEHVLRHGGDRHVDDGAKATDTVDQ